MNIDKIEKILKDQPNFRLKQVYEQLFSNLITDWNQATNLPKNLIEDLENHISLEIQAQSFCSKDKRTNKIILTLSDGSSVEAVLMRHSENHNTVCVSTQIGCPVGCAFCATGQMGFGRNLNHWEMIEQVLYFDRLLSLENQRVSNIVFMGMGEPFLNSDDVFRAIEILNNKKYFNVGSRRISISTVGIIEGINKLIDFNKEINLAISLHAPNDNLRGKLIPINKNYPIQKIIQAVDGYIEATHRKVMFEYVMIEGVNDDLKLAEELVNLLKGKLAVVNLIIYNQTQKYQPSKQSQVKAFRQVLEDGGLEVVQRYSFGHDIKAACGQLITQK